MTEPEHLYPALGQRRLVAIATCLLMGFELANLATGDPTLKLIAGLSYLAFFVVAASKFGMREFLVTGVGVLLTLAILTTKDDGVSATVDALGQAAFLAAFIQLMALLREAAITSPAIRACGAWLTRQPPGRRYIAMHNGGHFLGVLLNFGAMSLLAPLIQQGIDASGAPDDIKRIRERRLLSAILRGFSWIVLWSPTTVTQALLAGMFAQVDVVKMMIGGFVIAMVMGLVGWAEDTLRWKRTAAQLRANRQGQEEVLPLPGKSALHLLIIFCVLAGTAALIREVLDVRTVYALMMTTPIGLVGWAYVQARSKAPGVESVGAKLFHVFDEALPNGARESATLGASAFLGVALAVIVPEAAIQPLVDLATVDPALFLVALPIIVIISCQFAVTPIVMVVFLGTAISHLEVLPVDAAWTAVALSTGWALSMTGSPFSAVALLLGRITGSTPQQITWQWNGPYTLIVIGVLAVLLTILSRF